MKRALLLSWLSSETEACARPPVDENSIQLTPADCTGNSIWSDEERNCACAWGWSGNDCDEWEDSTCYYPEYSGNYEGNLNTSVTDLPCVSWTDNRVAADFAPNSTAWTKGKLGEHNYCRNPDNDPVGFWCYVEEAGFEVLKPGYCKITECKLTHKSFLSPNTTNVGPQDSNAALDIIYGPVLPGVCGGVVALMTIVGFGEFLRRRRIFQKLRRRFDPEAGAPRRLGGVVTVDVDTGLQPELGNTQTTLVEKENLADSDGEELGADDIVKKSTGFPKLGALKEEEEDQDAVTDRDEQTDSRIEKTEPMNTSGSSSDSEDELGTSASVQEEKREFEAGLSDLRHKLAQEVILEEEEEPESEGEKPDPNQPQFGMMKFRRSGKSVNIKSDDPDNPILEVSSKKEPNINEPNLDEKRNEKFQPMSIGSARSSSRNSFVLNTISRFETQSIASIKGEEMEVAINDIHNSKLSDYDEKRPSKHRKERRASNDSIQRLQESRLNHEYDRGETGEKGDNGDDDHRRKEERRKRREKEKRRRERREDERETSTKDEKRRERRDRDRDRDKDRDRDRDRERRSRRKK